MGNPQKANEFLQKAFDTLQQRGQTYDANNGERSMGACVTADCVAYASLKAEALANAG